MAGGVMAHVTKTHAGFKLTAIADPDQATRERFAAEHEAATFATVSDMLAADIIDAIYIATPHQFHAEHAIAAARAGKHIILEKPMALSLAECDDILGAADQARVALVVGHTHSFAPGVRLMADMIASGEFGKLAMVSMLNYTDFLYRPRRPEELDTAKGGGILFNQLPHQVDIVRLLASAPVRSVRASTAALDPARPTEGAAMTFIDFENGASASLVYSGYDRFDSDEFHGWVSEGGYEKTAAHGASRRKLPNSQGEEIALRRSAYGFGSGLSSGFPPHQPHFGVLIASCEHADLRQSPAGVIVYDDKGAREVEPPETTWRPGRGDVLEELYQAVIHGKPAKHDGAFGRATVETCLAIKQSAQERREITVRAARSTTR